ncbi:MAG: hypothetical protein K5657_00775 [Desulfovibrio sp.]|nr:hypothetical protein [Desulfovibrio sp.]
MYTQNEIVALENYIREALKNRKKELRLSDAALGRMAFPYMANPKGKVQALLVGQGTGENRKPQTFRIGELFNLCEAMGITRWVTLLRDARCDLKH